MEANYAPKTNISKAYYRHLIEEIEHEPLVKHSTLSVACMVAAICVLTGALLWYAKSNPGNLIQTSATVSGISTGKTDAMGTESMFVTFDFTSRDGKSRSVRQQTDDGLTYSVGQEIKAGYHPKNPNFARNLHDNRPTRVSVVLWIVPIALMIWFMFVALFRHHARQVLIWDAAEAADSDD